MSGKTWGGLVLLLALVASPVARADPKDDARRHFVEGLQAAREGRYEDALAAFLAAQEAYPHPATLFNIARSYADLGDDEKALEYYRRFQEADPERAAQADEIVRALEARLKLAAQAPAPAPAPPAATATPDEVARLQEITAELAALTASLQERATRPAGEGEAMSPDGASPAAPGGGAADTGGSEEGAGTLPALPEQVELLDDAYQRVVVTASRYGQDPLESPSTVTILTSEDIRLSGAATIADVLRRVAGVDVMTLSAAQPDISIRGFNRELANKVLVLVDGRSVYMDMLGTVLWETLPVAMDEIERIEVIRGPGSAVYGANAVTGVINIITKAPGQDGSLVVGEVGTAGYRRTDAIASGRVDRTAYRLSAGYHELGRWERAADLDANPALRAFDEDDSNSSRVLRVNGRVDRTFGKDGFASLSAGHARGRTEFYVFGALGNYRTDFQSSYVRGDAGLGPVHLMTFYNQWGGDTGPWLQYDGERSLWTTYNAETVDVELEANVPFETGVVTHRLSGGLGYRYKRVSWGYLQGDGAPIDEEHQAAYVQENAAIGPVHLVGSLRLDRHPLVDLARTISPRGAAIVRVAPQTSVRANVGTSFRSPTFLESYLDLAQSTEADGIYIQTNGNPELAPERILTGELGLHDASTTFHEADVAAYVSRVTDLIYVGDVVTGVLPFDPEENGYPAGTTTFTNLPQTYIAWGGEVEGRLFPVNGLDVYANLAIERITETDGGVTVVDGSTSAVKCNLGAMVRLPWRVDVAGHLQYSSGQTWRLRDYNEQGQLEVVEEDIPGRAIAVAHVGARPFSDGGLELALSAWNIGSMITGEGFREHPKGQRVGSRLFGSATWRF
ncbi:MAG: TonB-dependent receptor [Deltaproteobacteria bacterium]|nr:MAG: TonB-dependent receptor [Deltaproteobacteria bacterium]